MDVILKNLLVWLCVLSITKAAAQNTNLPVIGFKSLTQVEGNYEFFNARQFPGDDNTTLLTGNFTGTLVIDGDSLQGNETGTSLLALKDSLDQWLWAQVIDGEGHNQISNALQRDNGWIVTGVFSDSIVIGDVALHNIEQDGIFVAGIDLQGDFMWASGYPIAPVGNQIFISRAPKNKFYLAAGFNGEFEFNDSIYSTGFVNHLLFTRFGESGTIERIFQLQSKNDLELTFLSEGVNGGVIIGGNYTDTIFHKRRFLANEGIADFFLLALDNNFQVKMLKSSDGFGSKKLAGVMAHNGGYLFYGSFQGDFIMDKTEFENLGIQNLFLMKINRKGQMVWHKTIGGNSHKAFQAFAAGARNEIYAMMSFRGELPITDTIFTTETHTYSSLLIKLDQDGNFRWVTSSDNVTNFLARMNERSRDGRIEIVGVSPGNPQEYLFNHAFEEEDKGLFTMELFDCDYSRKVNLEDTLYICGPGLVAAEEGFQSYLWNDLHPNRLVEIESSTSIYLTVTDEYGCVSMDTAYVEVLPLPQVTITGNPKMCPGDGSALLIADGNYSFTWNNNTEGAFLHTYEPGYYEVTAINEWGCEATADVVVDVYAEQMPLLDETYFISIADTLTIYPGEYATYQWSDGTGLPVFTMDGSNHAQGLHEYSVDVTDFNGCAFYRQFGVYVMNLITYSSTITPPVIDEPIVKAADATTEELELIADEKFIGDCPFLLYPNPGDGIFHFALANQWMEATALYDDALSPELMIFTTNGELLHKVMARADNALQTIDISNRAEPGLYYAVLVFQNRVICVHKLMLVQ
jgi:hypothetical protein